MSWTRKETFTPGWDSGAISAEQLPGDGGYTWTVGQATGIVCGFNNNDTGAHYNDINHGFYIEASRYRIIESGSFKTTLASYTSGATFKVQRRDGTVTYYIDDALVYTSDTLSDGPVFLDCSLYAYNDEIFGAAIFHINEVESLDVDLSPITAFGLVDDITFAFPSLSLLTASGVEDTTARANVSISPLQALGTETDTALGGAAISPLFAWGHVDWLIPDINSGHAQLSPLSGGGMEQGALPEGNAVLSPVQALGVEGDVNFSSATMLPLDVETYMGQSNYFTLRLPSWSASISTYWINAEMPSLAGSLSAKITGVSIHAEMPSIQGNLYSGATLAADLPSLEGTITAHVERKADISATLPIFTGQMFTGATISTTMPKLAGNVTTLVERTANVSATMPRLSGSLDGTTEAVGNISATLPIFTGEMFGTREGAGSIAATLPRMSGVLNARTDQTFSITGTLPAMSGRLTAGRTIPHDLSAAMPRISGFMAASVPQAWAVLRHTPGVFR